MASPRPDDMPFVFEQYQAWYDVTVPGAGHPQLVSVLSRRMGELLTTVDSIAEDIQLDLAREAERSVLGDPLTGTRQAPDPSNRDAPVVSDAVVTAETQRIVRELNGPTSLASIASRLRATFGSDAVMAGSAEAPSRRCCRM